MSPEGQLILNSRTRFGAKEAIDRPLSINIQSTEASTTLEKTPSEVILVVDDEANIRRIIHTRLSLHGYTVVQASDGEEALERFHQLPADLIVLDVMLPRLDGYGVLERLRQFSDVPILMLTACSQLQDKVMGLELGADDYLIKPFSLSELEARIRCLLRRAEQGRQTMAASLASSDNGQLEIGALSINLFKRQIFRSGERVRLTGLEFSLLEHLIRHSGCPVSRMDLLQSVWGYTPSRHADSRVIDVHIARLRQKLESDPQVPELILTVRGEGYQFQRIYPPVA